MKLKLSVDSMGSPNTVEEIRKRICSETVAEVILKDGHLVIEDPDEDFSQTDVFEIGRAIGKGLEYEAQTQPETFHLPNDYAENLKQAIRNYSQRSHIQVDSISVTPIEGNDNLSTVTVQPTTAVHLFNIAAEYGKLCEQGKPPTAKLGG